MKVRERCGILGFFCDLIFVIVLLKVLKGWIVLCYNYRVKDSVGGVNIDECDRFNYDRDVFSIWEILNRIGFLFI